jgi:NFU1 iron-sulfur cluster scaffold homolog, mitochondrial
METKKKIPTEVYAEMTPNPLTMRFVANRKLIDSGAQADYTDAGQVGDSSPLAKELFCFPFVRGVFISGNSITVTRDESLTWDLIVMQLREYIRDWLMDNEVAVAYVPEAAKREVRAVGKEAGGAGAGSPSGAPSAFEPSPYDEEIVHLLEEFVRPAVEQDGGAIDFAGFSEGKVFVHMRGSCNGCPSSMATLKGGIENLLRSKIEAVTEVVPLD